MLLKMVVLIPLKKIFMINNNKLLFFVDEGGFEDFTPLFVELGYTVDFQTNPRKAVQLAKKNTYKTLVAEFSYNPEFRDRVSNIESILATLEKSNPNAQTIVLFDPISIKQFKQFIKRYKVSHSFALPVSGIDLKNIL